MLERKAEKKKSRFKDKIMIKNWLSAELFLKKFMKEKLNPKRKVITERKKKISIQKKKIKK